ncbi:hypothetical protein MTYP_02944 [Methylophilaceae bacterium]|nr:hypothetical protein MTYP_02944 [Methylophilaceae bacterium]
MNICIADIQPYCHYAVIFARLLVNKFAERMQNIKAPVLRQCLWVKRSNLADEW